MHVCVYFSHFFFVRVHSLNPTAKQVSLLDYGAGNVRSVRNALKALGYEVRDIERASDIASASKLVFPGVGTYGQAMSILAQRGYTQALKDYIASDK